MCSFCAFLEFDYFSHTFPLYNASCGKQIFQVFGPEKEEELDPYMWLILGCDGPSQLEP